MSTSPGRAIPPTYTCEPIKVLEGLEPVRMRPGMYIGGRDEEGLGRMLGGLLATSAATLGADDDPRIVVTVHGDRRVSVEDFGPGLPTEGPDTPLAVLLATTLLGHGRWRSNGDWETGLGVDLAVANALSWRFEVDVRRGGRRQSFTCRRGRIEHPLADSGPAGRSGNKFALVLDDEIFDRNLTFTTALVQDQCERFAVCRPGLRVHLLDERDGRTFEHFYPEGPLDRLRAMGPRGPLQADSGESPKYRLRVAAGPVEAPRVVVYLNYAWPGVRAAIERGLRAAMPAGLGVVVDLRNDYGLEADVVLRLLKPRLHRLIEADALPRGNVPPPCLNRPGWRVHCLLSPT